MSLKSTSNGLAKAFSGDPGCEEAYQWVLGLLRMLNPQWLPLITPHLPNGVKGNMGEFVAFHLSQHDGINGAGYYPILAGPVRPLVDAPDQGLDICFVYLDPAGNIENDRLYIQEVKTTGNSDLVYANNLLSDYEKLLGSTGNLNLEARILAIKARLMYERGLSKDEIERVELLTHPEASKCIKVRLLPTLIHEAVGADPVAKMTYLKAKLLAMGWLDGSVEPRSLGFSKLNEGFLKLSKNQDFNL